jgi:hypothetical protein
MTCAARETTGISRQRSYWLRCFLGMRAQILTLAIGALAAGTLPAQTSYDCFYVKSAKVAHIRGEVVDQTGAPVNGANVELLKQGAQDVLASQKSDDHGQFEFDEPSGKYWVHVKANGFQPTELSVRVDHGFFSFFNTRRLFVVLAVGGTAQPCPAEITSKKQLQEYVRDHASKK